MTWSRHLSRLRPRFSLGTLIVLCLVIGLILGIYVRQTRIAELGRKLTAQEIALRAAIDEAVADVRKRRETAGLILCQSGGGGAVDGKNFELKRTAELYDTSSNVTNKLFEVRIDCERNGLALEPIHVSLNGGSETDAVLNAIKACCDGNGWTYTLHAGKE